jgi:ABC-type uncharacterized transport system YnjBCD ATPase subunit
MLIIQQNGDILQKSLYELQKLSNYYNFNISTTKSKVMAFQGKYTIRSKIILNNKSSIEQVPNFNCLICNVTYKYDEDLNDKLSKLQNICGVIARTLKKKTRKEKKSKILQNYGCSSTFIWQRNMDTVKGRLKQNSSGRDKIFKNS